MLLTNFQNQPMESSRRDRDTHTQQGAEIQSNKFRNIGLSMLFKVIKITNRRTKNKKLGGCKLNASSFCLKLLRYRKASTLLQVIGYNK